MNNNNDEKTEDITSEWLNNLIEKNSGILGISKETYKNILNVCIQENALDISTLEKAILSADYENIQRLTHKLIGVFSNLQIDLLAAPAINIDGLAKKKEGVEEIRKQFDKMDNAFKKIRALSSN